MLQTTKDEKARKFSGWRKVDLEISKKKTPVMLKVLQNTLAVVSTATETAAGGAGSGDLTKAQSALKMAVGLLQRKASISQKFAQVHFLNTRKIKQALAKSLK